MRYSSINLEEYFMSTCITDYLSDIKDPRVDRKKLYSLTDILTLSICAMLSGSDSFNSIAEFGRNKEA